MPSRLIAAQNRPFALTAQASALPPKVLVPRISDLRPDELLIRAATQNKEGEWYRLRGSVELETSELILRADEVDYNEKSGYAEARGNVHFQQLVTGEELWAERVEYFLNEQTGKFFRVRGKSLPKPTKNERPGTLVSTSPFLFEGDWAERLKNRYILYRGFITTCRLPKPWWVFQGPKFDIIPGDRAVGRNAVFRVRRAPVFFLPVAYKSLEEAPRRSGFLLPSIGNSSRWGKILGLGYYWAPDRSYDMTYRFQWFSQRGFAHHGEVRGKPTQDSDFNAVFYGVDDKGLKLENGDRIPQGGWQMTFNGRAELPKGFSGRAEINYLSSFTFRQAFTQTFTEAVYSEVHSVGYVARHWSTFALNAAVERTENYQSTEEGDKIVIRKLPSFEFLSRDRRLIGKTIPLWWSLESSAALLRRNQKLYQTRQFVERLDVAPRVMTALRWKDFHLIPYFGVRGTQYGSSRAGVAVRGDGVLRTSADVGAELLLPSLSRVFDAPRWLGDRLKHVIEPRAGFRYVSGIDNFHNIILFDEQDLLSNTQEIEYSLTQRLLVKRGTATGEIWSWQVLQKRYFDPTFGGALVDGRRNVLQTQLGITAYAFLDGARSYSPVISSMTLNPLPNFGVEWRMDYDPLRQRIVNSAVLGNFRRDNLFLSIGQYRIRSVPELSPNANQMMSMVGWGRPNMLGLSAAFLSNYDFLFNRMQFATWQVTYNSDCCGLSFQYRRFNFGTRQENQFRVAFAVANIGTFGTLRLQERLF